MIIIKNINFRKLIILRAVSISKNTAINKL